VHIVFNKLISSEEYSEKTCQFKVVIYRSVAFVFAACLDVVRGNTANR
jgi:hypothetical protein